MNMGDNLPRGESTFRKGFVCVSDAIVDFVITEEACEEIYTIQYVGWSTRASDFLGEFNVAVNVSFGHSSTALV
jgi:hypothetical protein